MSKTTTINKSIFLKASREIVWSFLTEKDKLGLWFHPADADLTEGNSYALLSTAGDTESRVCWGTVQSMNKPSSLTYTFTIKPLDGVMTTINWTLEEAAGGTRLTLMHEGIGKAGKDVALGLLMALDEGWDKHLAKMRMEVSV